MAIVGRIITIVAGTAERLTLNTNLVNSITIQGLHGGTGLIYVLSASPQETMVKGNAGTCLIAELGPATATAGTTPFSLPVNGSGTTQAGGMDTHTIGVDGSHSGDTVAVSWDDRS